MIIFYFFKYILNIYKVLSIILDFGNLVLNRTGMVFNFLDSFGILVIKDRKSFFFRMIYGIFNSCFFSLVK